MLLLPHESAAIDHWILQIERPMKHLGLNWACKNCAFWDHPADPRHTINYSLGMWQSFLKYNFQACAKNRSKTHREIAITWMLQNHTKENLILVRVMAWCRQIAIWCYSSVYATINVNGVFPESVMCLYFVNILNHIKLIHLVSFIFVST